MSVTLDPSELGFRRTFLVSYTAITAYQVGAGPFTHEVTQLLRLSNPSKDPIAFKASSSFISGLCQSGRD